MTSVVSRECLMLAQRAQQGDHYGRVLLVPAAIGFALLVAHSVRTRGASQTLKLMLPMLLFGFLRESDNGGNIEYQLSNSLGPHLGGIPVIIPVGWTFASYLGLCVAEAVAPRVRRFAGNIFSMTSIIMITVFCTALCVEITGAHAFWWWWKYKTIEETSWVLCTPKFVLLNWTLYSMAFTLPYLLMQKSCFKHKKMKIIFISIYLFPLLGRMFLGPMFNVLLLLVLAVFIFVLPFKARLEYEP